MQPTLTYETMVARDYYTVAEAAAVLRVSRTTVWRWIDEGRLTALRVGPRMIRIAREELSALVEPRQPQKGTTMGSPRKGEPPETDIWAGYDPTRVKEALRRAAGALAGIDRGALLRDIRAGREQESTGRPV
jgi:excisionase family DNA binding protein